MDDDVVLCWVLKSKCMFNICVVLFSLGSEVSGF